MTREKAISDREPAASKALVRHEKDGNIRALHSIAPGKHLSIGRRMFPLSSFLWPRSLRRVFAFSFRAVTYTAPLLLFSLIALHSPLSLNAQTGTATLSGIVTDEGGAIVPNCEVQLQSIAHGNVTIVKTNDAGIYVFSGVQPGQYDLTIRRRGFKQVDFLNLLLNTQDHVQQNFRLQVGSVSESVTVNANNEHMQTDSAAVGLLVDRTFVENMPLNGRSFQDLISLGPGTVSSANGSGLFSINGQREDANYYTVDGVAANLNPGVANTTSGDLRGASGAFPAQTALGTTQSLAAVDALQEFKIQTSGYAAEYGRQPGGQIEITTRSGTNDVHGTLFDYFRNEALDANSWIFDFYKIPKQAERQNDFGGTIGGPLEIPMIYNGRGKTFYFFSYEGLRLNLPGFVIEDVPTIAFRKFAAAGVQPFFNALPLPNGPNNGDQCAASLNPNNPAYAFSCTAKWDGGYSVPSSLDSVSFRIDQIIGQKVVFFFRFSDIPSEQTSRSYGTQINSTTTDTRTWTLGTTAKVASNLLDELRFNYSESGGHSAQTLVAFAGAVPYPKSLVIPPQYAPGNTPAAGAILSFVPNADHINIPYYSTFVSNQQQYNLVDSLSWTSRRHTMKFGADYRRLTPLYNPEEYYSNFYLSSLSGIQQGFADTAYVYAQQHAHPVFQNLSIYAQDHWRVRPRLTLDFGLRWELNPTPGASDGIYPLALTSSSLLTTQLAPPGTPQYHTIYHNLAPRVGFAYEVNPSQTHSFVLRGGFGVFYDTGQSEGASGYAGYPFSVFNTLTNLPLPASPASIAPPALNVPLIPPYGFINGLNDPQLRLPYTEQWNLTLDQRLNAKNTLSVSYLGNAGKKLLFTQYYTTSVNPDFANGLQFTSNAASSSYNALQVQDQGYITSGMQLIASYTWAHAIDNASTDNSQFAPLRGNSDNDIRQVFNAALNYQIQGTSSNRFLRALTQGWSWDNRFIAQSGYPLDPFQNFYSLPNGSFAYIRPDLVAGVPIYLHGVHSVLGSWALNPAAFSPVPIDPITGAPVRVGTLGRNYVHGPNFWTLNLAIQRAFPLREQLHLVFRAEAFNILNHPNPGSIDPCLCDSTFGQSNGNAATVGVANPLYGTGGARSLQLMLKLQF